MLKNKERINIKRISIEGYLLGQKDNENLMNETFLSVIHPNKLVLVLFIFIVLSKKSLLINEAL